MWLCYKWISFSFNWWLFAQNGKCLKIIFFFSKLFLKKKKLEKKYFFLNGPALTPPPPPPLPFTFGGMIIKKEIITMQIRGQEGEGGGILYQGGPFRQYCRHRQPLHLHRPPLHMYIYIKLCENTKNYQYDFPGSNNVVYGACEQESEEKNFRFWFLSMQNLIFWLRSYVYRWVDFRT